MNQFLRSRTVRVALPTVAALAVAGTLTGAPAYAADEAPGITATFSREGDGMKDVVPDAENKYWPAGNYFLKTASGEEVEAYCIDFDNFEVEKTGKYQASGWPAAGLTAAQLAKVTDIVSRHSEIGTEFEDSNWEVAATQVAVWSITDSAAYTSIPNVKFRERVKEILDGATQTPAAPTAGYSIESKKTVSGTGNKAVTKVDAVLRTSSGAPVVGEPLEFVLEGEKTEVVTDAKGAASFKAKADSDLRTISINFETETKPGVVFAPTSGKQPMIAATGFSVSDSVKVSLEPTAVTEEPPADTPDTPVTVDEEPPVRDDIPTSFPETGASSLGLGLLGAAGVTGLGVWGRRKFRNR